MSAAVDLYHGHLAELACHSGLPDDPPPTFRGSDNTFVGGSWCTATSKDGPDLEEEEDVTMMPG